MNADGYRVYRGTTAGGENSCFASTLPSLFDDGLNTSHCRARRPRRRTSRRKQSTVPLDFNAAPSVVQAALEILPTIGKGNVLVTGGAGSYSIQFTGALGHRPIALLGGATSSLRSNGINAIVTLDGGGGGDTYNVNLIGGRTELADQRLRLRASPPTAATR